MSTINFPGLATGIDTKSLIAQLMEIEKRTITMYQQRKATWDDRKDALDTLESKLSSLKSAVKALSDSDELRAFKISSSDPDIITADASSNAFEGNHNIVINQLADSERWVHTAGLEYKEDYVGAGTFIYSYNHKETTITTTATTTLESLVGLINNDANNPGVTAGLLYYNDAYHLVLNGNDAGSDYEVSVNASSTEVWQSNSAFTDAGNNAALSTNIVNLDQFSGSLVSGEKIIISGKKNDGTIVSGELNVTSNTKLSHLISEIEDTFGDTVTVTLENGKIRVTDNTSGASQMELTLTYDPGTGSSNLTPLDAAVLVEGGAVTANLAGFTSSDFTETQSAKDSQIRVDGYPPGDWISRSSNTVDDVIQGVALHLNDITDANGQQITLTRDIQSVKDKLNALVTAYNTVVTYVQEKAGYNNTLKTGGILMGDYVVSNIRSQIRMPLYSQTSGFVYDIDTFLNPAQIGFALDKDGMLSLNTNTFDQAVAENYMGVLALIGADKTGSSTSDKIKFYDASSQYTTASEYQVEVVVNESNQITSAKIKLSTESAWRDMTISDNIIIGNSTFDDNGNPLYAENGLQLSIDVSQAGTFTGTVRVKQGFTGAIEDVLNNMLRTTTGSIQIDQEHVEDIIEGIQKKIENEQERLTKKEARLVARFANLEKTLSLIQQQMNSLGLSG